MSKIALIGDTILDYYYNGQVNKISPELPMPIFTEKNLDIKYGGVYNVYNNLLNLGSEPELFTGRPTSIKKRYVVDNHVLFRSDCDRYEPNFKVPDTTGFNVVVLSDYNKGFLHYSAKIIQNSKHTFTIVDPKKSLVHYQGATIVKLNENELSKYSAYNAQESCEKFGIQFIIVTMADKGIEIYNKDELIQKFVNEKYNAIDVVGAGDVFLAVLAHYINEGNTLIDSSYKAMKLASLSVTKFGTCILTKEDIATVNSIIVFTNGCFDVLHRGHIEYLKASKALGTKLIVGLNSDNSVKRLKGMCRPINSENDRKFMLENLGFVDEVIIFDEDTPLNLIREIKPDILTKGGDYSRKEDVIGHDLVDQVVILPYYDGHSTTQILEKIRCVK